MADGEVNAAVAADADIDMIGSNLCIRCGKPRIEGKTWTQKVDGSLVTYTQTVCSDRSCQKAVEGELRERRDKVMKLQQKSLERRKASQIARKRVGKPQ